MFEKILQDADPDNIFFACVEGAGEAVMITNTDGVLVYVNPAWTQIYGYSKEEAIGNTPALLHSGVQDASFYKKMWEEISNPAVGIWKGELINRSRSGELIPVLLTITPYRKANQEIVGHMGIAIDMREQKKLETQVMQQDRLASIGVLASGLAHEIGTPLGVIRGRAEFLQIQNPENSHLHKTLSVIIEQIDRISKLITSLLKFSRKSEKVTLKNNNLFEIVDETLSLLHEKILKSDISLDNQLNREVYAMCDFDRTQQILINLILNSIHAMKATSKKQLTLKSEIHSDFVDLAVQDTGKGIPEEQISKIFDPFFTTKDVGEGTGLGLSIVSKLVSEMNAEIIPQSIVGEGTQFTIRLKNKK